MFGKLLIDNWFLFGIWDLVVGVFTFLTFLIVLLYTQAHSTGLLRSICPSIFALPFPLPRHPCVCLLRWIQAAHYPTLPSSFYLLQNQPDVEIQPCQQPHPPCLLCHGSRNSIFHICPFL